RPSAGLPLAVIILPRIIKRGRREEAFCDGARSASEGNPRCASASPPFVTCHIASLMTGQESSPARRHLPVLPHEVVHFLSPQPGHIIVDAAVGGGGHALLLAERVALSGRVIGLDRDPAMLELARSRLHGLPVTLIQRNFDDLPALLKELEIPKVDGILADLGVCSDQLDDPARGLSFQKDGPLDMRLDPGIGESAADLLRRLPERDLANIFWKYGEERFSRRLARKIVEVRKKTPLETT